MKLLEFASKTLCKGKETLNTPFLQWKMVVAEPCFSSAETEKLARGDGKMDVTEHKPNLEENLLEVGEDLRLSHKLFFTRYYQLSVWKDTILQYNAERDGRRQQQTADSNHLPLVVQVNFPGDVSLKPAVQVAQSERQERAQVVSHRHLKELQKQTRVSLSQSGFGVDFLTIRGYLEVSHNRHPKTGDGETHHTDNVQPPLV